MWAKSADRRSVLGGIGLALIAAACSSSSSSGGLTKVPAGQRIPDEVLRNDASFFGTYTATWHASDGSSGTGMVIAKINIAKRTASAQLSMSSGFFGHGTPAVSESQTFDLDDFAYEHPPYRVVSKILGPVTLTGPGSGYVRIEANAIPGHHDITSFGALGYLTGGSVLPNGDIPFQYEIRRSGGSSITGNIAFHQTGQ